ncbi:hypothetical protein [Chroococcus sp. FPU101]|uniref:hypothetical protein n=1 Tax=Chroococcus sp. FPU101 TaxID=1974212 RepID=UPI001A8E794E|nr:hypothetical protein [Chroococcus sp. FPU101]GFE69832.1 hypothetical protein CFPU101_24420 [Chroococcus sp. FPU101]
MDLITGAGIVTKGALYGAGQALGHQCVKRHINDFEQVVNDPQQVWDDGWQKDYEAGGISSWGQEEEIETA